MLINLHKISLILIALICFKTIILAQNSSSVARVPTVILEPINELELYNRSIYGGRIEPKKIFPQTSLVSGVIRSMPIKLGSSIKAGELLFTVQQTIIAEDYLPTPIYSQNSGTIIKIHSGVGDRVQTNDIVVSLATDDGVRIVLNIGENDFFQIKADDPVYLTNRITKAQERIEQAQSILNRSKDEHLIEQQKSIIKEQEKIIKESVGVIGALPLIPNYQTGLFTIEAIFNNSNNLFFGKFERIELRTNRTKSLAVNQSIIVKRYGRNHLPMVDENNIVYYREIELGSIFGEYVTILSGVSVGEKIIVQSSGRVRPGDSVEIQHNT